MKFGLRGHQRSCHRHLYFHYLSRPLFAVQIPFENSEFHVDYWGRGGHPELSHLKKLTLKEEIDPINFTNLMDSSREGRSSTVFFFFN